MKGFAQINRAQSQEPGSCSTDKRSLDAPCTCTREVNHGAEFDKVRTTPKNDFLRGHVLWARPPLTKKCGDGPPRFHFASAYNSFSRLENCVQNYLPDALDRMVSSVPVGRSRLSLIEPVLELIQSTANDGSKELMSFCGRVSSMSLAR